MKKNNKIKKIIILILIILFLLIIFSTIFSIYYSMNNNIVEGIEIQGISVSGITKENAENKLNEIINNLEKEKGKIVPLSVVCLLTYGKEAIMLLAGNDEDYLQHFNF